MKISIIIPVYNAEKYLDRCLDSVLTRSFSDYEILLINDGSTDRSGDICEQYAQCNNKIRVFHQENYGVSIARNVGIRNAKGDYIGFLDADDYLNYDLSCIFDLDSITDYDLIAFKLHTLHPDGKQFIHNNLRQFIGGGYSLIERENISLCLYFTSYFYRREYLLDNDILFNPKYNFAEDDLFIMTALSKNPDIRYVDRDLYTYVQNVDSVIHDRNFEHKRMCLRSFISVLEDIKKMTYMPAHIRNIMDQYCKCNYLAHIGPLFVYANLSATQFCKVKKECREKDLLSSIKDMNSFHVRFIYKYNYYILQRYFLYYKMVCWVFNRKQRHKD